MEYIVVRSTQEPGPDDTKYCGLKIPEFGLVKQTVYIQITGQNFTELDTFKLAYKSGKYACFAEMSK